MKIWVKIMNLNNNQNQRNNQDQMKVLSLKKVSQAHPQASRNLHHLVLSVSYKINSYYVINVWSLANLLDKGNLEKENLPISFWEIQQLMTILQTKKIIGVQIPIYKE